MRIWNSHGSGPGGGSQRWNADRHRAPRDPRPADRPGRRAFNVIGIVQRALRDADVPGKEISQFHAEATSGGLRPRPRDLYAMG
jgi:hypothetical protein